MTFLTKKNLMIYFIFDFEVIYFENTLNGPAHSLAMSKIYEKYQKT